MSYLSVRIRDGRARHLERISGGSFGWLPEYETACTDHLEAIETGGDQMARVGYRRVSTSEQRLERQDLSDCDKVFEEQASAGTRQRQALADMIDWVREGDEVVVWSIDRLARDLADLQDIVSTLNGKGTSVSFISERLSFSADQSDALARLQLQMMGAFAEFERSIIRKRQAEGIAKAKARGAYKGRKPLIDYTEILDSWREGLGASEIARRLRISRASVYRGLASSGRSNASRRGMVDESPIV